MCVELVRISPQRISHVILHCLFSFQQQLKKEIYSGNLFNQFLFLEGILIPSLEQDTMNIES